MRSLGVAVLLAAGMAWAGCGQAQRAERQAARASPLELTAGGISGARLDAPAALAARKAIQSLGRPDRRSFSGCELGGAQFVRSQVALDWSGLRLTFSRPSGKRRGRPEFIGWSVTAGRPLPTAARLPHGLTVNSAPQDVRSATTLTHSGIGLPGIFVLEGADGIQYAFDSSSSRLESISVRPQVCE